ncbi:LysR family transcriptional regulator [Nordella sp. HKS 07]|uniref:LysR family transcriptional regulator n=1 Tax=Nordella sp. HKS 07 TaxID=2712222 RepID=UPI0013E11508|nr:LysR family transcriptional regulator [Nordella sp. HKS 07]QIG49106.1 LysR family transcriptional regulator [Nordella sp. HKS 07]
MTIPNISNVDLKLLHVFMTVARSGGFALAQTELNVSQATISIHIKNLETRLGLSLCQRGRGGFALTEDGQRVYDATNALFNHIEDFRSVALGHDKLVGELQIAIIDNAVFHRKFQLGEAIERFGKLNHSVDFTVHVAPPNKLEEMVLGAQAHMGIGFFPRRLSQLSYAPIFTSRMELFCGKKHPLYRLAPDKIDLAGIEAAEHAQRGYVSADQLPENERNLKFTARAHSIEGLAHLILSGQYLAFLPIHYAEQWTAKKQMRSLLPELYAYESTYEVIRRKSAARTPAEMKFYDLLMAMASA